MNHGVELTTVYRSADSTAQEDAEAVRDLLSEAGLAPVLLDDGAPGVPAGAYEVRVPADQAERAEDLVRAAEQAPVEAGDPSHDMDLVTIFSGLGANAEVEALGMRAVLDADGIPTVFVSPPQYPNLRFVVKVPRKHVERARQVIAEALAAGPQAAEEAEVEGENPS
jgi:hypothetical protein